MISLQAGLAAAVSAFLAQRFLGPGAHVFAPAAAVGTIATALGQRARRTFELLGGVGLGIVVADTFRLWFGAGPWQTGAIVTLAIACALLLTGRGGALVGQAGGTAVLVATLAPHERNVEVPRIVDALLGGAVGLAVVALLLPIDPIRVLNRFASPVFATLAAQLRQVARALRDGDEGTATRALDALRAADDDVGRLNDSLSGAQEVITLAPARWPRRMQFERYSEGVQHLRFLLLFTRALARWAALAEREGERVPAALPESIGRLSSAVERLGTDLRRNGDPEQVRALTGDSVERAGRAWCERLGPYGSALFTNLRTAAGELLQATGCTPQEANRMVRLAVAKAEREHRPVGRGGPDGSPGVARARRPDRRRGDHRALRRPRRSRAAIGSARRPVSAPWAARRVIPPRADRPARR